MSFSEWIKDRTGGQAMLYVTYTTIPSVDFTDYGISPAKGSSIWGSRYKTYLC